MALIIDLDHSVISPVFLAIAVAAIFVVALLFRPTLTLFPGRPRYTFYMPKYRSLPRGRYRNQDPTLLPSSPCRITKRRDAGDGCAIVRKQGMVSKAIEGVICAVCMVVESRDPYTAGHQRRVAELARAIAGEMGLSDWQVTGVYVAGLLHDVGKMAIPFEILSKPGKLTDSELSIIKTHCQVGYEILRKIDFPWPVTTAILQHHERLDGSGYPSGLGSKQLITEARILGVADVVEAMSSHRPYRPALGLDSAMAEIAGGRSVLYDSDVADACIRLLAHNAPAFERIMAAASTEYSLEPVRL
jgi:putative nucleotidyltransferase with HDIG domain